MADLTRTRKYAEKKVVSVSAADVKHDEVDGTSQILFDLPANCMITEAIVQVDVAGQALLTVDIGFSGGAELGNDLDIDDVGPVGALALAVDTGTGKQVTALFSADPTAGEFVFIIQYIEYTLGTGCLTNYVA